MICRDVEAVAFRPLPLPPTKSEKTTVDNFFNFCGSVAVAARPYGCRAAAPPRVFVIAFFRIFYDVNIFYNVIVYTLFTNAPAYVATKTNFLILLALN